MRVVCAHGSLHVLIGQPELQQRPVYEPEIGVGFVFEQKPLPVVWEPSAGRPAKLQRHKVSIGGLCFGAQRLVRPVAVSVPKAG